LIEIILFIVDSGFSKHMIGNLKLLSNFVEKFLGTVKFGNDQIASILDYGDLYDIVTGLPKLNSSKIIFVLLVSWEKQNTYFLRSKDETPKVLIDFLKLIQRGLHAQSSVVTTADAPNQRQQQHTTPSTSTTIAADIPPLNIQTTPKTTSQAPTQASTVTLTENINQAETKKEYALVDEDEFINIFSTPVQERGETSSQYVDSSNMLTFYQ
ncbi:hypothetical protein Tco_1412427, partial [Tanacetum coccineum]